MCTLQRCARLPGQISLGTTAGYIMLIQHRIRAGTVHLGLRTILSSCTSALHTTREASLDPAR